MGKDLESVNKVIDTAYYHVFYKGKEIPLLRSKTMIELKKNVKQHVEPPKVPKKILIYRIKYDENTPDKLITISCIENVIKPSLIVSCDNSCVGTAVVYSKDDYRKYGFKKSHLMKIYQMIEERKFDLEKQFVGILDALMFELYD